MRTVAVIAEYNPFHNGHLYQLECAKRRTGADRAVVLMCGDYTQRGEPAIIDKYSRAESALRAGADLVIMMPVSIATSGAQMYADGCIKILDSLGCIDFLSFGCECGNIGQLKIISDFFMDPPEGYLRYVNQKISEGMTYAAARQAALVMSEKDAGSDLIDILVIESPNNILGIEYLKALAENDSRIEPSPVTRMGSGHDEENKAHDGFCEMLGRNGEHVRLRTASASAIRRSIGEGRIQDIKDYVPEESYRMIVDSGGSCPVNADDYSLLLHDRIVNHTSEELSEYYECSPELADRIKKREVGFTSFTGFAQLLKTKEMTYSRISRVLMHIVLGIKETPKRPEYIRVLGFRESAGDLMHEISLRSAVPMITKAADAEAKLSPEAYSFFLKDISAAQTYDNVIMEKFGTRMTDEYRKQFPIIRKDISL